MALNPVETLNVFDPDLRKELRSRSLSTNLVRTRTPFIRFTTAANMDDLSTNLDGQGKRVPGGLGPQFDEYKGYKYFTLGLHGYSEINYSTSDLYGTKGDKGLVIGTTYKNGTQKLVYTHGGGQISTQNAQGAIVTTAAQSARNYPPPGIINARVERLRNGNVLRFTIDVQCYTQEQLKMLDAVCFVPGMTCVLEWGNQFTTPTGTEKITKKLDFTNTTKTTVDILDSMRMPRVDFIKEWCKPNKFNYDFAVAQIANVKTQLVDNVYKVNVIAYGVADNIMYIAAYATNNPLSPDLISREQSAISSINEYFKLNGKFSSILRYLTDPNTTEPQYKNKVIRFSDPVDIKAKKQALPTSQETGTVNDLGLEDTFFISMDFFIDAILNNNNPTQGILGIINKGLSQESKMSALISPLTNNPTNPDAPNSDTIYAGYNKYLRSTNPETMIIQNNVAREGIGQSTKNIKPETIKQIGTEATRAIGALKDRGERTISETIAILKQQPFGQNVLTESGIAPLTQGVFINSKAVQAAFLNARTVMEGMETLLRNMNAATENYWDLKLYFDDDKQQFRILDDNVRNFKPSSQDKIYEFNKKLNSLEEGTIGPDVLNIEISTDYPKLLFSQLAISGINGGMLTSDPQRKDVDFRGNTSVRDIFKTNDAVRPPAQNTQEPTRRDPGGTQTISAFIENIKLLPIFTQNVLYASGIQSQLRGQFAEEGLPIEVGTLLQDLYSKNRFVTVPEANDFTNRLSGLLTTGKINSGQSSLLTTLFAERAKAIITKMKNAEKDNFTRAYKDWISKLPHADKVLFDVDTPIDAVSKKIEESKQKFLTTIQNAQATALTNAQNDAIKKQREEEERRMRTTK